MWRLVAACSDFSVSVFRWISTGNLRIAAGDVGIVSVGTFLLLISFLFFSDAHQPPAASFELPVKGLSLPARCCARAGSKGV